MAEIDWAELDRARQLLGLGEQVTLAEIKQAHRRLAQEWHPDKRSKKDQGLAHEKMKEVNRAYKIILKYIEHYRYDLTGRRDKEEDPQARWQAQFGDDPIWGSGKGWFK